MHKEEGWVGGAGIWLVSKKGDDAILGAMRHHRSSRAQGRQQMCGLKLGFHRLEIELT